MKVIRLAKDENGAIAVIFALTITSLLIICSLALDFGLVYFNISKAQNAIDASLLASGQYLPVDEYDEARKDKINDVIEEYLTKNGMVDLSTLNIEFDGLKNSQYTEVNATLKINTDLNFARIIGYKSITSTKFAAAKVVPNIKVGDVVPLAVKKGNLDEAIASGELTHITLKYGGGGGTTGDFGAIDLDGVKGGGASDYERWLTYGFTKEMVIGEDLYPVESGNMAGATATAINTRYNSCTHFPSQGGCNNIRFDPSCPRVLKSPVVVNVSSKSVKIVAFAAFVLDEPSSSSSGYVTGSFIHLIIPGAPAENQTDINDADYGIYSLRLSH